MGLAVPGLSKRPEPQRARANSTRIPHAQATLPVCGARTPPARRWGCGCGNAKNRALAALSPRLAQPAPDLAFFELASPHPRAAGFPRDTTWGASECRARAFVVVF